VGHRLNAIEAPRLTPLDHRGHRDVQRFGRRPGRPAAIAALNRRMVIGIEKENRIGTEKENTVANPLASDG
jgi:hypothetical protein